MVFAASISVGVGVGLLVRIAYLLAGHRSFPTYPHGLVIHLFLGFIAATLGALGVAALASANLTAGVFLAIGTAQFHTIRDLERDYMAALDRDERVPRGPSYVEGMATAFEARNFLIFAVAALATALAHWISAAAALVGGLLLGLLLWPLVEGPVLRDIAQVELRRVELREGRLVVEDVELTGVEEADIPLWRDRGVALVLRAKGFRAWLTLSSRGQCQAIRHDLTELVGLREGERTTWPLVRRDAEKMRLVVATVPFLEMGEAERRRAETFTVVESAFRWRR